MSWLPLPYIQLESARTNAADYLDTQWNAGYGFGVQFAGCAFADGGYLFGAMTSEDSADKFALQFQDGKYIWHFGDQTAESPATYELGEPHYFSLSNVGTWYIDGVSMPSVSFSLSPSNEMTLPVYIGAVNVGGEAQNLSDVQIGYINFAGTSGAKIWHQCKTQDGQFGFVDETTLSLSEKLFVEKPDFSYGGVMAAQSGTMLTIVGAPTKKDYKLGEPFDVTGTTVYLNLDDGTQRDVTDEVSPNSRSYSYFKNDKIYRNGYVPYFYYHYNPVGVEYSSFQFGGGKEYSVSLPQTLYYTVSPESPVESIEVTRLPDKTDYLIKEYFNTTGMVVTGHLEDGDTAEIGDNTNCSGVSYPLSTAGTFDVTVSWYNGTTTLYAEPFQITVKNGVEKLEVTLPTKSEYSIGEKFNPTGITVTALYLDGTERPIYNFFVDSSKFDSTKEGGYAVTVKATVDEKEYTETITVYVFGEPKKLEDLLGTTEGMTVIRNNVKNDDNKDTVPGVDWFVFDGNTASNIYVSGNNFISFDNTNEHIKICRRDGAIYYVYSQVGKLDNGHKFLKIRIEGYTHYGSTASEYALKYELFLFDDNSMFLNILQAPTNTSYLGTSELLYGTTHTAFTVEAGKAQEFHFLTSDPVQGKQWTVIAGEPKKLEDLLDTTEGMDTLVDGVESDEYDFDGVPWFNFDGKQSEYIGIYDGAKIEFARKSGSGTHSTNLLVCCYDNNTVFNYLYRQEGILDNGCLFLKIRLEGYSYKSFKSTTAVKYEVFLFSDGGIFLNVLQVPTEGDYLGESGLRWSGNTIPLAFKLGIPKKISFYTSDPAQGKDWKASYYDYDFTKESVRLLTAVPTKRQYNVGDGLDEKAFDVTATWIGGRTEKITDFSVDSANFDNTKEGRYTVTVTAGIGGKEYTAETLVAVYGEPHSIYSLIGTEHGMQFELLYFSGITHGHIYGVPWFVFDGKEMNDIEVNDRNYLSFTGYEGENFSDRGTSKKRTYGLQEGVLDNGHRFLKIRAMQNSAYQNALYELFFFDDNSMFLNVIKTSTNQYTTQYTLKWSDGTIQIPVEYQKPFVASFYTTDTKIGKPWTAEYAYHKFFEPVGSIFAFATKREYAIGEYFDKNGFSVKANLDNGTSFDVTDYTVDSSAFNNQKEGRYTVTVKATILGTEYTAPATVVVYGDPHNILDLLNTSDGMVETPSSSYDINYFGDVSWFVFDGKAVEKIGLEDRSNIFFNDNIGFDICQNGSTVNRAYTQEGRLKNDHKFFKLKVEPIFADYYADYELFLFDDNSIFLNIISTPQSESSSLKSRLSWSEGEIEIPVTFSQPLKASFYTDSPYEGKPWTMEVDYHNFIKENMRTLTVDGGSGSGLYLPGELVTIEAEEKAGNRFRWVKDGELFSQKPKIANMYSGYSPSGFKDGNLLVFAYWDYKSEESSSTISGWAYDGTLTESGDKDAGSTENVAYVHIYHKINDGNLATGQSGYFFEVENAKSLELQESTRQENLLLTSANSFLCKKETDDLYLWFLYAMYWSTSRRWVTQPDVVSYFPDVDSSASKAFSVLFDENVPPVSFRASVSSAMATRYGSAIGARIIPSCTGYEYKMTFAMPDEDLTVTAEYELELERIEVTNDPFKLNYALNQPFDPSGMVVTAFYADGSSKAVSGYRVAEFDNTTVGAKEVTISYTDGAETVTAKLTVYVGISGIMVTKYPDKTRYALGEVFEPEGLEVSIVYADNSTMPTEHYSLYGFSSSSTGIKNITVNLTNTGSKYQIYTTQFSVAVTKNGDNPFAGYNADRALRIHFPNGEYKDITGDEIESESMSLTESLGNDKNLRFGGCISTQFSVNIFSDQFLKPDAYPEGNIEAYLEVGGESLKIFTGTIDSADRVGGINKRKIIAYDCLKEKGGTKLRQWYGTLTFPMTQKEFRDSLFAYVGIVQAEMDLVYDDAYVPDNMNADSLTFLSLAKDICLNNMVFGHINADGQFEYIRLKENAYMERDPFNQKVYRHNVTEDAIPDDEVISSTFKEGRIYTPRWFWLSPDPRYPYIQLDEPEDIRGYRGDLYFVRNSYMIGDKDWINRAYETEEVIYADTGEISSQFRLKYPIVLGPTLAANDSSMLYASQEYSLTTPGNFLRRIGTNIAFNSIKYLEDGTPVTWKINSYIMSRTITGVRSLRDVYTAKNSTYDEETYGASKQARDNSDSISTIKDEMPKSTEESENGDVTVESLEGVDLKKDQDWEKTYEEELERIKKEQEGIDDKEAKKLADQAAAKKTKERKNALTIYGDGTARYNGTTISGSGSGGGGGAGGGFNVVSVESLPENPDLNNTIYLIQGEVVVE